MSKYDLIELDIEELNLPELKPENLINQARQDAADEITKKATVYARAAMYDIEHALNVMGTAMSEDEYQKVFRAMLIRKAKGLVRRHNASQ